jgi:hypothetical protein
MPWRHRRGVEAWLHQLFSFGARWVAGVQRRASAALSPGQSPRTRCTRGWVGRRARMDGFWKYKTSYPHRGWKPEPHSPKRFAIQTEQSRQHYKEVTYTSQNHKLLHLRSFKYSFFQPVFQEERQLWMTSAFYTVLVGSDGLKTVPKIQFAPHVKWMLHYARWNPN